MSIADRVMKITKNLKEEAPVNSAGAGNIAGMGVGPQGEPGVSKKNQKKHKTRILRRKPPVLEEIEVMDFSMPKPQMGKFAGEPTFIVPHSTFLAARNMKKEKGWWSKYIEGEDHHIQHIRDYANKNLNKPIYLECERTGAICCARYGKK